jgi:hypothetical protein
MGNRSKFMVASAAVTAGVLARKRRARLRAAAEGIGETILPTSLSEPSSDDRVGEGHAPGHQHVGLAESRGRWLRRHGATYGQGDRHPYVRD